MPAFDNWYYDRSDGESWGDYVLRSASQARERIALFDSVRPEGTALFVLVACDDAGSNELTAMQRQR